ncbi:MAG: hypothetical protein IAG13_05145 [Deltaproteobacteria bacterium]|nr:hypothetical protein [Nannocystaceae bacterium]
MKPMDIARTGVLVLSLGCGGAWNTISFEDEGELCFAEQADEITVEVTAPDCLSSSCTRDVEASCTAAVEGQRIVLTSEIQWEENNGRIDGCTLDCGSASATCSLGRLADGAYTVVHGEEELALTVPVDGSCPL